MHTPSLIQVELLEALFDWQEFWKPFAFMLHGARLVQMCRMLFGSVDRV